MAFESDYGGFGSSGSGSGGGAVSSVFGRVGAVTAVSGDYAAYYYAITNAATPLVDQSTIDISTTKNTLTTSSNTRTFTISYTGDIIRMWVILNATSSTFTFPATALCVSEGIASGDNTCGLSGISGDKYYFEVIKEGSNYTVLAKNLGQ